LGNQKQENIFEILKAFWDFAEGLEVKPEQKDEIKEYIVKVFESAHGVCMKLGRISHDFFNMEGRQCCDVFTPYCPPECEESGNPFIQRIKDKS
jgi:hypothetical protein